MYVSNHIIERNVLIWAYVFFKDGRTYSSKRYSLIFTEFCLATSQIKKLLVCSAKASPRRTIHPWKIYETKSVVKKRKFIAVGLLCHEDLQVH